MTEEEQLLRRAYEAFNARDIDAALALMHLDVDWPNGMEGGRERGLISEGDVQHLYTLSDGLVERMDIRED